MERGYMISDASRMVEVENHVLRYWEEELELSIPRNEMGHRFYRETDIKLLRSVKDLKEQGFQLKAIKKLLPDIGKIEKMDPQGIYRLREELNQQVLLETMEGAKASITPLEEARERYGKRQKTWQERSYELEQIKKNQAALQREGSEKTSMERLQQFELMMKQMICGTMEEMSRESEERICKQISERMQKEMSYLLLQKEELHEKQMALLQEILAQIKEEETSAVQSQQKAQTREKSVSETAAQKEAAATEENKEDWFSNAKKPYKKKIVLGKEKKKRKKLFAK